MPSASPALRLTCDGAALVANWRWLAARGEGAACGAAVKADGYGLGAREVASRLIAAGCRDLFVSSWPEAEGLGALPAGVALSVLHGVRAADMAAALASPARPVLNSPEQVARWRAADGGPCDVMIDTGINRLGIAARDLACLDGLPIDTLMSHLATADDADTGFAELQRARFAGIAASIPAKRTSLANSAGVCLGAGFALGLTRPGLALYGGVPRPEAAAHLRAVALVEAEILQVRSVAPGETVGYGGTWAARRATRLAILNIGYADGYGRAFSNRGRVRAGDAWLPVVGRVSMDLIAVDTTGYDVAEGDWLALDPDLARAAHASGLSQYELLTALAHRYARRWL